MKLIQYISTSYVREELYNPDNCDLINPKSPPEFISSGGPFCHKVELEGFEPSSPGAPVKRFSRPPHSTTLPPLRRGDAPAKGRHIKASLEEARGISLAERWGFEPQIPFWGIHDFQSCSFGQLGHLSA